MNGPGDSPATPEDSSFDRDAAIRRAIDEHVLSDRHPTEERAFDAALGQLIVSYLDSLSTKARLEALLALKGEGGFPERRMLEEASEEGRGDLLSAARKLHQEGKLRRVLNHTTGEIFWKPAGPLVTQRGTRKTDPATEAGPPSPRRAHDGGPQGGGHAM